MMIRNPPPLQPFQELNRGAHRLLAILIAEATETVAKET